jgi:competence ComEA-like helix-hairpin-helix protein
MHETEFPTSKTKDDLTVVVPTGIRSDFANSLRLFGLGLFSAMLVCSCARLPRHVAADAGLSTSASGQAATSPRVNINAASTADLESLPGIGKVLAERIVGHRERYGSFRRVEHLMMVRGISDHKFRKLRVFLTAE